MLQKRERHLENQMAKQDEIAKANVTTNKTGRCSRPGPGPGKVDPRSWWRAEDSCTIRGGGVGLISLVGAG